MSFFGLEQNDLLEREKEAFRQGAKQQEDLAVYTWGEESYDGLGDALQEGGDDLNDETFGGTGAVGKDFDFTQQALPLDPRPQSSIAPSNSLYYSGQSESTALPVTHIYSSYNIASTAHRAHSLWDEKSPFSVLPRSSSSSRFLVSDPQRATPTNRSYHANGGFPLSGSPAQTITPSPIIGSAQSLPQGVPSGARTLEEIEAEMHAAAQQSRNLASVAPVTTQRQQLLQEQQQQQQQHFWQQQRSAPPRMHPQSQSPRFHQQQQQQQLLQQQQLFQQQQLREQALEQELRQQALERQLLLEQRQREQLLQEQRYQRQLEVQLQEQAQMEELERGLRAQRISEMQQQQLQNRYLHQRQTSSPALADIHAAQQLDARRQRSPALLDPHLHSQSPNGQVHPQNIQRQQRLLSEFAQAAQAEFMQNMQSSTIEEQEILRAEAMRRIMETERMEEKRRRKAAKIAHMSRYNDLMTQSDKDFITRIQVSQLVTQDPYAEDFYAQVYGAILRSQTGQSPDERVLKFGSGGGVGLGLGQKGSGRRPNAMQRMQQQVERIVNTAAQREHEKNLHSMHSLQGALGKTSGRSYKAAPRQLLQVSSSPTNGSMSPTLSHAHIARQDSTRLDPQGAAKEAARMGAEALGGPTDPEGTVRKDPLTSRETLVILENLYDIVLSIEHLRREQPPADSDDFEAVGIWNAKHNEYVQQLWDGLQVMVPLETSEPHPFISLITPAKGKKILPRLSRHLSSQQMLTMLTLMVACFSQMDVVAGSPILDFPIDTQEQREMERQTQTFLGTVVSSVLPVVAKAGLRLVSGLLGLLMERSNIITISQSRPGLAFLTLFLSRVEVIKQSMSIATDISELPSQEETEQWELMFDHLFDLLHPHLVYLFPSTRLAVNIASRPPDTPVQAMHTEALDHSVWQFLAALALHASNDQQQILVTALREKVLENVASASKGWVADEEERVAKLANVNLFLHALGLDSSQISI
ncbi:topoisomerase II-associated protein PAT1 [Amylostereum chailletii]|nr:topoisomerase II-associated protein PAT1 [Amylostereum chailletii]